MPRGPRAIQAGGCYHVINRGNNRATVFHRPADFSAFVNLIRRAQKRRPLDIFAACLMPNHFHLVVRPPARDDLGRWMHWLLTTHAHHYNLAHGTSGRVWQGRYKAFPIEQNDYLITVLRYVERNAVRAGYVIRARDWKWGSAAWRWGPASRSNLVHEPPVKLPASWDKFVDAPQTAAEVEAVRKCLNTQRPYGSQGWLDHALECKAFSGRARPRGRPRLKK